MVRKLFAPAEVAEILKVSTNTVNRWARQRKLPSVEIDGVRYFRRAVIALLIEGNEVSAPEA